MQVNKHEYASACWVAEDILELKPEWGKKQANDWLKANEDAIREAMIIAGWDVIEWGLTDAELLEDEEQPVLPLQ